MVRSTTLNSSQPQCTDTSLKEKNIFLKPSNISTRIVAGMLLRIITKGFTYDDSLVSLTHRLHFVSIQIYHG